ncbi:TetR/AcrR family transcriptional regulator [Actinoplanes sp. NPDC051470]|uniref:TetR/AcrR family transcriptional regulator n=1 Tax=unclassified Actinoplanes TaxID=2626549 RepID=UPI00342BF4C6
MDQQTSATLRADARRNREQIIEAARTMFLRKGPDVPMDEIARAAGVGVGTLYRRFPDRSELIKAVSQDNLRRMAELAGRLERDEPDPAVALDALLHAIRDLYLGIVMTSVSAVAVQAIKDNPVIQEQRDELLGVVSRLLRRCQEQGSIRPDIDGGDLLLMLAAVSRLVPAADDDLGEMAFHRLFALMMDAFRPERASPLPGRPVDYQDVEHLRQHGGLAGFGRIAPNDP